MRIRLKFCANMFIDVQILKSSKSRHMGRCLHNFLISSDDKLLINSQKSSLIDGNDFKLLHFERAGDELFHSLICII